MPAEKMPVRSVREILRLRAEGLSDRAQHAPGPQHGERLRRSGGGGGTELAVARRVDGHGAGGAAVRARRPGGGGAAQARARLGQPASRAAPALRYADAAVAGVPGGCARRLRLLALLRTLRGMGEPGCRLSSVRPIRRASGCSSTMPARPSSWSTAAPARCAPRRSSSPCWVRRATPGPRRPGRRRCPTASARMCVH
jgi:hypothetical protein